MWPETEIEWPERYYTGQESERKNLVKSMQPKSKRARLDTNGLGPPGSNEPIADKNSPTGRYKELRRIHRVISIPVPGFEKTKNQSHE
jgi:hypothetical protein